MNMGNVSVILTNTITKEWRSKTLLFLLIINILIICLAGAFLSFFNKEILTDMSLDSLAQKTVGIFFLIINFWSFLVSAFFGVGVVRSDSEEGVLPQLLAFPISRGEYLIGRILGTWTIVMLYYVVSLLMAIGGVYLAVGSFAFSSCLIGGLLLNAIPNLIVIVIGLRVSLNLGKIQSFIVVMLMVFFISASNALYQGVSLSQAMETMTFMRGVAFVIHWIAPHISYWGDNANELIMGNSFSEGALREIAHLIVSGAILGLFTFFGLKRKEV
jgi:ABC-type transport system involved in multi-copper enzyme maturation permease subunit